MVAGHDVAPWGVVVAVGVGEPCLADCPVCGPGVALVAGQCYTFATTRDIYCRHCHTPALTYGSAYAQAQPDATNNP